MSGNDTLAILRLLADSLIVPLLFTLWQSTLKIAKLEAQMNDLRITIDRLTAMILRNGGT